MSFSVQGPSQSDTLADVIERILDKGIVIAGDVSVSLVGIELLTIRLRLLIATVDKAREIGINWWESDPSLSVDAKDMREQNRALLARIDLLEQRLAEQPLASPELAGGRAG